MLTGQTFCVPFKPSFVKRGPLSRQPWRALRPLSNQATPLDGAYVILVAPKHASNVGSVARALANFEVSDLRLVSPRCDAFSSDAYKTACNSPAHARLQVADTLQDALAGSAGSIGFTRRAGATRQTHASIRHLLHDFPNAIPLHPHASPPETSSDGSDMVQSVGPSGKVALVFGREERVKRLLRVVKGIMAANGGQLAICVPSYRALRPPSRRCKPCTD
ncbi:hypothetical protein WJX84_003104 [Apatococcus fuscideae]|uniref:tRNA/rRNA methyltransferase SpoU type domain-containing protein n=1 Tax=Apatococcus fuscideae TaxID=2026836 RepID=A0AAW1TLB9_9CHLO